MIAVRLSEESMAQLNALREKSGVSAKAEIIRMALKALVTEWKIELPRARE